MKKEKCPHCPLAGSDKVCAGQRAGHICERTKEPGYWRDSMVNRNEFGFWQEQHAPVVVTPVSPPKDVPMIETALPTQSDRILVVSRYREDLEWLKNVKCPIHIMNKGSSIRLTNGSVDDLPNTQREAGSMLNFIVNYYDQLPPLVMFVQGSPEEHCPDDFFERLEVSWKDPTPLSTRYTATCPDQKIKDQDWIRNINGFEVRLGDAKTQAHENQTRVWYDTSIWSYLFQAIMPKNIWFGYGAQWAVPRDFIRSRTREFWAWLLSECADGRDQQSYTTPPVNPWTLEASWLYLWHGESIPHKWTPSRVVSKPLVASQSGGCGCGGPKPKLPPVRKLGSGQVTSKVF
jgi:hypothetical protein